MPETKPLTEEQRAKRREYARRWAANNRDKVNASNRAWKARHREQMNAQNRQWRERNREHVSAYNAAYWQRNKGRLAAGTSLVVLPSLQTSLKRNEVYVAARAVVPTSLPRDVRDDIVSMIVLAVLEGEIRLDDVAQLGREFTRRHYRQFSPFDTVSLDVPVYIDGRRTLHDTLTTENAVLL